MLFDNLQIASLWEQVRIRSYLVVYSRLTLPLSLFDYISTMCSDCHTSCLLPTSILQQNLECLSCAKLWGIHERMRRYPGPNIAQSNDKNVSSSQLSKIIARCGD